MKRLLITLLTVLLACVSAYAHDYSDTVPLQLTDPKPSFNGGDIDEFAKWINARLVFPEKAKEEGITGRVMVQFIVLEDGSVSNVRVIKSAHPILDKEAVRLVSSSPKWEPGMVDGKPVNVAMTHSVSFMLVKSDGAWPRNWGPVTTEPSEEAIPFQLVEQKPSFKGGDANEFSKWVNSQLVYPKDAKAKKIQGRVTLQFTIESDGSVTNVNVLKGVHPSLDEEAVRVVSSSPKWKPGTQRGKPVRVTYTFPITFGLR